jgi:outer membrane murein-binding lipoprotein Lpp
MFLVMAALMTPMVFSGCKMTSEQQIAAAQEAVPILQEAVERIDQQIEIVQQSMLAMEAILADPNTPFGDQEKVVAKLAEYRAELAKWRQMKTPTATALAKIKEVVDKGPEGVADITDVLRMAAEAMAAVAPMTPPQVSSWLNIVSMVLMALLALFGTGGAVAVQKLFTLKTAFTEVVAGGEKLKKDAPAATEAFRAAQAKAQKHESTRLLVDKTQKELTA